MIVTFKKVEVEFCMSELWHKNFKPSLIFLLFNILITQSANNLHPLFPGSVNSILAVSKKERLRLKVEVSERIGPTIRSNSLKNNSNIFNYVHSTIARYFHRRIVWISADCANISNVQMGAHFVKKRNNIGIWFITKRRVDEPELVLIWIK